MRRMTRIILLVVLVISLCGITTTPVNAAGGQKQKAHGAGKTCADLAQFGWSGTDESHINFTFEAPDKGYYEYRTFAGPWAGSWARIEVKGLYFGSYEGNPAVYYWGQCTAGETYTDLDYPGIPFYMLDYLVPYTNIEGWYKVGVMIDGGPGHENDGGLFAAEIPPDGEAQAQQMFNMAIDGEIEFGYGSLVTGNINIK